MFTSFLFFILLTYSSLKFENPLGGKRFCTFLLEHFRVLNSLTVRNEPLTLLLCKSTVCLFVLLFGAILSYIYLLKNDLIVKMSGKKKVFALVSLCNSQNWG